MSSEPDDVDRLSSALRALHRSAAELAAQDGWPPARLRIRVGDVSLEAAWATDDPVGDDDGRPVADGGRANGGRPPIEGGRTITDATNGSPTSGSAPAAAPSDRTGPALPGATGHQLVAPVAGTFYRAPEPGASPFVDVGDRVQVGDQVAIVEAMKLMIPVKADRAGRVTAVLLADGDSVDQDAALFTLADAE